MTATKAKAEKGKARPFSGDRMNDLQIRFEQFAGDQCPYELQQSEVDRLKLELAMAEGQLAAMAKPLERIEQFLLSPDLEKMTTVQPYDAALKKLLGKIRVKTKQWHKKMGKFVDQPTGARPWKELRKSGADHAQLMKNLKSIDQGYGQSEYRLAIGKASEFTYRGPGHVMRTKLVEGNKALLDAVRRVMEVGPRGKAEGGSGKGTTGRLSVAPKKKVARKKKVVRGTKKVARKKKVARATKKVRKQKRKGASGTAGDESSPTLF